MVEISCGSKRRRSDGDENERIALRQMIFNMSMCKLNKDIGRKEPSLLRSVIITNTVRQIENEMDEEMISNFHDNQYKFDQFDHIQENIAEDIVNNNLNSIELNCVTDCDGESNDRNDQICEPSKFGAIGDRRKITDKEENMINDTKPFLPGFLWDSLSLPAISTFTPALESVELEQNFLDVDISLYDFDNPLHIQTPDWRVYPSSCAMEFEHRKPDAYFEELDQIMQVLVGM